MIILIPEGTEIFVQRPGKKQEDEYTWKSVITKKDYDTEVIDESNTHYAFIYKCLQLSKVYKNNVSVL